MVTLTLTSVLAAGCATASKGSYCDIAQPIRPSVHDMLTEETKRQILVHDETLAKLCGVKP